MISEIITLSNPISSSESDIHCIADAIGNGKFSSSTFGSASVGKSFGDKAKKILCWSGQISQVHTCARCEVGTQESARAYDKDINVIMCLSKRSIWYCTI